MKKSTSLNHPPAVALPQGNRPLVMPIYQSVKFDFENLDATLEFLRGDRPGFFYSRAANPTTRQLELQLAGIQGRDDCVVTGSGVGAMSQALLALTRQGDHVLCFVETYNPTRYLIRRLLGRFGVNSTMLSIEDLAGVERVLRSTPTRLVVFESPTNPVLKVADIEAITRLAQAHGALTLLDNTFAGLHQHGQYPLDLFVHSLTKYASGAGDVMGGAVIGRSDIIRRLRGEFGTLGGVLDPHAAFLIARGLKTYFLRYEAQTAAAQRVAEMLAAHPGVARVRYPGLAGHPQHDLARRQMQHFGTVVTLDLNGGEAAAARFADALQLFSITASLGSTESLVVPSQMMSSRDLTPEQAAISGVSDGTVRLSIGLEDVEDLLADLAQALERAGA
ncbi:MAG TPA: aminotransferase class I/II-fold pyridoxal phosphate-dependent enzyme [Steroidobacteraceae bacterium]|nr:aminotransferase class I/II-fold pyridoxal phosphate-dependent enzyme [Steroidobacteraceae bacterium]